MPGHSTIYAIAERPLTAGELQRLAPAAAASEERAGLLRRLRSVSVRWPDVRVTLNVMDRAEIPAHLAGFAGFLRARSPDLFAGLGDRIASVRQVLGVVVEPGFDAEGRAERLIRGVAGTREAILLRADGIYDATGACLSSFEERREQPRFLGEAPVSAVIAAGPDAAEDPDEVPGGAPPSAERVARRLLALAAVVLRGSLEDARVDGRAALLARLRRWTERHRVAGELEPAEAALLAAPLGSPPPQAIVDATWRAEGLVVLAWALGLAALPRHDEQVDLASCAEAIGVLADELPAGMRQPMLRDARELEVMARQLLGLHWRLRDFGLQPRAMDFRAFARSCWFGGFDLTGVALVDDDLAIHGAPIARADAGRVRAALGIARERHQAIAWVMGSAPLYSQVDTST